MANEKKLQLLPTQVPAFPFAPVQYEQKFHDQLQRILTQYLNQTNNITSEIVAPSGGRFISFPHIAAYDSTNQYADGDYIETVVKWGFEESNLGFTLNLGPSPPSYSATAVYSGIYKIDYSLQFVNTDSQAHIVYVWLKVSGEDVIESASKFSIPSKHGSFNGALIAYSSLTFQMDEGDYVELYWATDLAYVESPLTNGVFMEASPAQVAPPAPITLPSIPSSVGTIAFVSAITT